MDLRVFTEPQQGTTFSALATFAERSEQLGFDGFFRSDHYHLIGDAAPKPSVSDAWVTLGALATKTSTIRLGTLMTSATFRLPGPLAVTVSQVDQMSAGRVELGIGAGWFEREHRAFAIPFPRVKERFDRLEEQLEIIEGLWATGEGEFFDYAGRYYRLEHCPMVFRPVQEPHPPVIIGGHGPRRTPALAARFASEFNMSGGNFKDVVEQFARVVAACRDIGRDPASLTRSLWMTTCIGRDEAEFARRAAVIGREPDELKQHGIAGLPAQALAALNECRQAGASRVYLQFLDLEDLAHLELAAEVLGSAD
ncbi:MAG: LLM class F420-dependent oxidoreductase [Acidimicrobiales bacterium]|jgi:F420-dependent oxidoreductase-like protein